MKKIYIILLVVLAVYLYNNRKTEEKFQTISDAFKIPNKRCTAIYGNFHPKCRPSSRMEHVGYFKFNTIKYPLLDLNRGDMKRIRHSKLPIWLESADELTPNMLDTISLNMTYTPNEDGKTSPWELWVDEYGEWFSPYKKNKNQLELFK